MIGEKTPFLQCKVIFGWWRLPFPTQPLPPEGKNNFLDFLSNRDWSIIPPSPLSESRRLLTNNKSGHLLKKRIKKKETERRLLICLLFFFWLRIVEPRTLSLGAFPLREKSEPFPLCHGDPAEEISPDMVLGHGNTKPRVRPPSQLFLQGNHSPGHRDRRQSSWSTATRLVQPFLE